MWRARPVTREPGLFPPRATALAASSRPAAPALARPPRHPGPRLASEPPEPPPPLSVPVPCPVGTHRAPVAPGGGRARICSGRGGDWKVCARRGGGRIPAAAGLSGWWRSTGAGRSPCGGCPCVFGSCCGGEAGFTARGVTRSPGAAHPPACVEGERARERREAVPVACVAREGLASRVLPSFLPSPGVFAPYAAAWGGRGPCPPWLLFVSRVSFLPGGTRSGAGPRDAAASVRRRESPPGVCEFVEARGSRWPVVSRLPWGGPASVGCASRGLRVS